MRGNAVVTEAPPVWSALLAMMLAEIAVAVTSGAAAAIIAGVTYSGAG